MSYPNGYPNLPPTHYPAYNPGDYYNYYGPPTGPTGHPTGFWPPCPTQGVPRGPAEDGWAENSGLPGMMGQPPLDTYCGYPNNQLPTYQCNGALLPHQTSSPDSSPNTPTTPNRQANRGHPYEWMSRKPNYTSTPTSGKTRTKDKYRIVYSEFQKVELEKEYLFSPYITIQRKADLAKYIGLSERQVKIWFQNRRAKERKSKRKREDGGNVSMCASSSPIANESQHTEPIVAMRTQSVTNDEFKHEFKLEFKPEFSNCIK